jgi:hypothetical protein
MAWTPGGHDSLVPPGFRPRDPIPDSEDYVLRHPTRYRWRKHVKPLIRKLYGQMGGPDEIHINTYLDHPEGLHRTLTSFDVWGPGGRGVEPIGRDKGQRVFRIAFDDPGLPIIEWAIWRRQVFRIENNYEPRPFGEDAFTFHDDHLHFTFLHR